LIISFFASFFVDLKEKDTGIKPTHSGVTIVHTGRSTTPYHHTYNYH